MVVDMMATPRQLTNVVHATYVKRVTGLCQARSGRLLDKRCEVHIGIVVDSDPSTLLVFIEERAQRVQHRELRESTETEHHSHA